MLNLLECGPISNIEVNIVMSSDSSPPSRLVESDDDDADLYVKRPDWAKASMAVASNAELGK